MRRSRYYRRYGRQTPKSVMRKYNRVTIGIIIFYIFLLVILYFITT